MKNIKLKSVKMHKSILALMLCAVMLLSVTGKSSVVCATGVDTSLATTTSNGTSEDIEDTNTDPNGVLGKNSDVGIEVTKSITGKAGKNVKVAFKLKSNDIANIKLKSVYPVIDNAFPFETSGDAYKIVTADDTEKQKELNASFKMTARKDISNGYHSVRFIGEYEKLNADGNSQAYYIIKTINIYFTGDGYVPDNGGNDGSDGGDDDGGDDGSDENLDDGYDDYSGGSDEDAVAPKLIITGYETVPEKVMAGETFKITIHIQNASKTTSVCNGKFLIGNEAGSFLPTSGSSAVFVDSIPAGETGDIEIEMKAGADLAQKNYSLVVKGDFDDGRGNNFTSSDSLTIPVYQEIELAVTEISMSPEIVGIDSETTLMFTINNKSNAGVYNVNVTVKEDTVSAQECYVGNIAGSSSAYATMYLVGVKDNSDVGTITLEISYEDADGTVDTMEQVVDCLVSEEAYNEDEYYEDEYYEDEYYEEDEGGFYIPFWVYGLIAIVILGVIAGVVIGLVVRRKKQMAALLEEEDGEDDINDENF
ncbi:MAG: hypothetical protein IJP29_02630 [Lachnospiraceae bacterium]|nr:hypothetical protein [Lachnospiraceae bacterium]